MLSLNNPMGIDQSKQAYQQAITHYCGAIPKIFIAHAHNAWIDTALAIGIPGAALLLLVLLNYAKIGLIAFKGHSISSSFGLALFASSSMWILRGLLDSTMRDQMLEMQAFIFATLAGIILTQNNLRSKAE
jgi:O-antigen ligase